MFYLTRTIRKLTLFGNSFKSLFIFTSFKTLTNKIPGSLFFLFTKNGGRLPESETRTF